MRRPSAERQSSRVGMLRFVATILSLWALAIWLTACFYVWSSQEALILPGASRRLPELTRPGVDTVWFDLSDGTRLRGGLACPVASARPCGELATILYFGGNAEDATGILGRLANTTGRRAIAYNYRGYAGSAGEPSVARFEADALEVAAGVAAKGPPLAVFGHSIGTGAAMAVAASRDIDRLVLVSPFDSVKAVAAEVVPWLPMSLLLRHDLVAAEHAAFVTAPGLVILAGADTQIPLSRSNALVEALGVGPTVLVVPSTGHNDVLARPEAWRAIQTFFRQ